MSNPRQSFRNLPILILLLLFSGCSAYQSVTGYFNTYYNTKKTFDDAVAESESGPQKGRDSAYFSAYAISPGTKTKFDKVIEKSSKIIQYYEKSNWLDDAIYMIGVSYVYKDENESAIRKFKELEDNFPTSNLFRQAKLWHAKAEYFMKKDEEALQVTKDLLDAARSAGDDDIMLEMLMLEGQIYFERQDYKQAVQKYGLAAEVNGDDKLRAFAQYQVGFTYERMRNYKEAATAYGNVRKFKPEFSYDVKARIRYCRMLTASGQYDKSLYELDDLIDQKPSVEQLSLIDLEIANTDWAKGDSANAFALYAYIDSVYKSTDASAKANYQRGIIYEKGFLDFKTALKHYTRARDQYAQSEINPLALQKVNSLTNYFKYVDNITRYDSLYTVALHTDTTSHAEDARRDSALAGSTGLVSPDSLGRSHDSTAVHPVTAPTHQQASLISTASADSLRKSHDSSAVHPVTAPTHQQASLISTSPADSLRKSHDSSAVHPVTAPAHEQASMVPPAPLHDRAGLIPAPSDSLAQSHRPPPERDDDDAPVGRRGAGRENPTRTDSLTVPPPQWLARARTQGKTGVSDSSRNSRALQQQQQPILTLPLTKDSLSSLLARNKFELAGLFYLELDLPDSGVSWYERVISDHPTSPFVPRSLYAMSEIYRVKGDSVIVDSLYTQLLTNYKKSEYAVQVRKILNMDVLAVEGDSASTMYHRAEQKIVEGQDSAAIAELSDLAAMYPQSGFAPKALYTVGWLYENVFVNNDTAAVWYAKLEKAYPSSVYAQKIHPKLAIKADPKSVSQFVKVNEIMPVQKADSPRTARTLNQKQGKGAQPEVGNDRNSNRDEDYEDNTDDDDDSTTDDPDDNN